MKTLLIALLLTSFNALADGLYGYVYGGVGLAETEINNIDNNLNNRLKTGFGMYYLHTLKSGNKLEFGYQHDSQLLKDWPVNSEMEYARDYVYVKYSFCLAWCE